MSPPITRLSPIHPHAAPHLTHTLTTQHLSPPPTRRRAPPSPPRGKIPRVELASIGKLYLERSWYSTHTWATYASICITVLLVVFLMSVCGVHVADLSAEILLGGIIDHVRLMEVTPMGLIILFTSSFTIAVMCAYHIYCLTCGWRIVVRKDLDGALGEGWESRVNRPSPPPRSLGLSLKKIMSKPGAKSPPGAPRASLSRKGASIKKGLYSRRGCMGTLQHMRDLYRKTFYVDGEYFQIGEVCFEWFQYVSNWRCGPLNIGLRYEYHRERGGRGGRGGGGGMRGVLLSRDAFGAHALLRASFCLSPSSCSHHRFRDPPHSSPLRPLHPSPLFSSCSSHTFSFHRHTPPPLRLVVQTVALHVHSVKGVSAPALALFAAVIFLNSLLSLLLLSGEMSQRVVAYVVIDGFTDLFFSFFIVICKVSRPRRFPSSHNEMRSLVPLASGLIGSKRVSLHSCSAWSLPRVLTRFALSPALPPQMLPSSFSSTRTMIRTTFRWHHSTRWCSARCQRFFTGATSSMFWCGFLAQWHPCFFSYCVCGHYTTCACVV